MRKCCQRTDKYIYILECLLLLHTCLTYFLVPSFSCRHTICRILNLYSLFLLFSFCIPYHCYNRMIFNFVLLNLIVCILNLLLLVTLPSYLYVYVIMIFYILLHVILIKFTWMGFIFFLNLFALLYIIMMLLFYCALLLFMYSKFNLFSILGLFS